MVKNFPEGEQSEAARIGSAAHELAESMLRSKVASAAMASAAPELAGGVPQSTAFSIGQTASNGVVFTDEMHDGAKLYFDDVSAVLDSQGAKWEGVNVEQRIHAPRVHAESFGTVDSFIVDSANPAIFIWDFKFGFVPVEAFENWQAINYAAGVIPEGTPPDRTVQIRIIQPRAFHRDGPIRVWSTTVGKLLPLFEALRENAHLALSSQARTNTGAHCKYCRARHACPAALTAGMGLFEVSGQPTPVEMTPEQIGVQFAMVKRAKQQLEFLETGLGEQVKNLLRVGTAVRGFLLKEGLGRECWARPVSEVHTMGRLLGYDLEKPTAITPTQARAKGVDPEVIKKYSKIPVTGFNVVADNDNKPREIFSK